MLNKIVLFCAEKISAIQFYLECYFYKVYEKCLFFRVHYARFVSVLAKVIHYVLISIFFYLKKINIVKNILDKFLILKNDFDKKHLTQSFYSPINDIKNSSIIKQNKAITPIELLSSIISNRGNKSNFYTPMHSFIPLFISASVLIFLIVMIAIFFRDISVLNKQWPFFFSVIGFSICLSFWFSMFWIEKRVGKHLDITRQNILFGFYLFIMTEGLCFLALFWTFLHSTLAASIHIGIFNPGEGVVNFYISEALQLNKNWDLYAYHTWGTPSYYNVSSIYCLTQLDLYSFKNIKTHINLFDSGSLINPWGLPFINTLILLSSAASLNASHCLMLISRYFNSLVWLFITILFGLFFVFMQFKEYKTCALNFNDGIYASCFFGITGLHGIHVILGIVALTISFFNILLKNYSPNFHQTFYFSIFYWHFVDVIWIFVWLVIYLWPGSYFFKDQYLSCYENNFFVYNINTNYFYNLVDYNAWQNHINLEQSIYSNEALMTKRFYSEIEKYFDVLSIHVHDYKLFDCNDFLESTVADESALLNWFPAKLDKKMHFEIKDLFFTVDNFFCIELNYEKFLTHKKYFNFNNVKRDITFFTAFLNEIHPELSSIVYNPTFDDLNNKSIRFFGYLFLELCFPKILVFLYCTFLFSPWYLHNI